MLNSVPAPHLADRPSQNSGFNIQNFRQHAGAILFGVWFEIPPGPNAVRKGMKWLERNSPAKVAGECFLNLWALLAQAELLERALVAVGRGALEILKQLAAAGDQKQEAPAGRVVFDVRFEMLGELVDALSQKRDLHVSAAGVFLVQLERLDVLGVSHSKFFK